MMLTPGGRLIVFIIFSNTLDLSDTADTWLEEIPLHIKKKGTWNYSLCWTPNINYFINAYYRE